MISDQFTVTVKRNQSVSWRFYNCSNSFHQFTHSSCITCQEITHLAQEQQNLHVLKPRMLLNLIKLCQWALSIHLSPFCKHSNSIIHKLWHQDMKRFHNVTRSTVHSNDMTSSLLCHEIWDSITSKTYFFNKNVFRSFWYTCFSFSSVAAKHVHAFWHMLESHVCKCCRSES